MGQLMDTPFVAHLGLPKRFRCFSGVISSHRPYNEF